MALTARSPSDAPPPITAPLSGVFAVTSPFEIPATAAAPGPVGDTLGLVHGFVVDPGAAILDFAGDAGVPGLGTLRSVLPDALESRLTGWMNDYIKSASVGGVTPYDQLVWLDDTIRALLLYWTLESRLALPVGATGTHSPVTLVFASTTGSPYSVPLDPTAQITSGIGVAATLSWPSGTSGPAVVTISDHFIGLPFGRYVLQALNAILLAEYGTPNLAQFLSERGRLPGHGRVRRLPMCQRGCQRGVRRVRERAARRLRGRPRRGSTADRKPDPKSRLQGHSLPPGHRDRHRRAGHAPPGRDRVAERRLERHRRLRQRRAAGHRDLLGGRAQARPRRSILRWAGRPAVSRLSSRMAARRRTCARASSPWR